MAKQSGTGRRHHKLAIALVVLAILFLWGAIAGPGEDDPSASSSPSTSTQVTPSETSTLGSPTPEDSTTSEAASDSSAPTETASAATGSAADALAALPVKGRAPKTGYSRAQFGIRWADEDHNGCDTRNDILRRDLTNITLKPGTHDCIVLTGTLADPYAGQTIAFTRGRKTSEAVQIDHVVALSNAWQTGAQQLDPARRQAFANDPLNLLAVDGPANQQKSDGDAATWLPANKGFRCAYVARQIAVKRAYSLWVTPPEKDAMTSVLSTCPGQPLP